MGLLDRLRKNAPELRRKAADAAATHDAKIESGIDQAAARIDRATGGKHGSKIQGAAAKAKDAADKLGEESSKKRRPPA